MISDSKSTLSPNNLKILWLKVTKNLMNSCKKFCESPLCYLISGSRTESLQISHNQPDTNGLRNGTECGTELDY